MDTPYTDIVKEKFKEGLIDIIKTYITEVDKALGKVEDDLFEMYALNHLRSYDDGGTLKKTIERLEDIVQPLILERIKARYVVKMLEFQKDRWDHDKFADFMYNNLSVGSGTLGECKYGDSFMQLALHCNLLSEVSHIMKGPNVIVIGGHIPL